eukprot:5464965-Amphidinium_carterae.1
MPKVGGFQAHPGTRAEASPYKDKGVCKGTDNPYKGFPQTWDPLFIEAEAMRTKKSRRTQLKGGHSQSRGVR